jgi:peptidyl-tRNA hydrolase, PTH2 family
MIMELKQVIVVRKDLDMPKGKLAVQVAHGSIEAIMKSDQEKVNEWKNTGMKKVVLKVNDLAELKDVLVKAKKEGLKTGLINDAGRTFLAPGTITVLGIGPDAEEKIDRVTGHLSML